MIGPRVTTRRALPIPLLSWLVVLGPLTMSGCAGASDTERVLTADMPLHLEDHLDAARIEGSELPATPPAAVEWRFDEPQPGWTAANEGTRLVQTGDALRVSLTTSSRRPNGTLRGTLTVDLPGWRHEEWGEVVIRARADSSTAVNFLRLGFNRRDSSLGFPPYEASGQSTPIVRDGSIQTYRLRVGMEPALEGDWRQLILIVGSNGEAGSLDLLSVRVIPSAALYSAPQGFSSMAVAGTYRRSLFTHTPRRLAYRVRVPEGGRLHMALGVLSTPVEFRVTAQNGGDETATIFRETHGKPDEWAERTVDLSAFAGDTITLSLETDAASAGAIAFWGSPTVSGARRSEKPNVIFYVIDGGWADDMSVYGYNRRTTPNLERLASDGVVFEHAYSNAGWTKPSTASFMTSLHNSVLGNTSPDPVDPLPIEAVTMAEHFHRAGYQTAVFTSNPNAGTVSGLQRGADLLEEPGVLKTEGMNDMTSSVTLHNQFWAWREQTGTPYWVHVQPTDVHAYEGGQPEPVVPFSGLFVTTARRREFFDEWARFNKQTGGDSTQAFYSGGLEAAGIDRGGFFETMRALYDESLAHQDYQIGRLVERLRERGEWENTLLIIGADHAIEAALWDLGELMQETVPPRWNYSILRPSVSRVPLIVVWSGHIAGGRRFVTPVSMIDVLPTVLDLVGLPQPDVLQGQSLAPLLRGQPGWTPRPVILDSFTTDTATGQLRGFLEVIDGQWGASLRIGPPAPDPAQRRPWPLLLYDLQADRWAINPINEQRPDLVTKYTAFLEEQWKAHRALATRFTPGEKPALTPEQLERLRSLGYIR